MKQSGFVKKMAFAGALGLGANSAGAMPIFDVSMKKVGGESVVTIQETTGQYDMLNGFFDTKGYVTKILSNGDGLIPFGNGSVVIDFLSDDFVRFNINGLFDGDLTGHIDYHDMNQIYRQNINIAYHVEEGSVMSPIPLALMGIGFVGFGMSRGRSQKALV